MLPVCWDNIVQLGDTTTNYQIMPGDRVFVPANGICDMICSAFKHDACPRCCYPQCPAGYASVRCPYPTAYDLCCPPYPGVCPDSSIPAGLPPAPSAAPVVAPPQVGAVDEVYGLQNGGRADVSVFNQRSAGIWGEPLIPRHLTLSSSKPVDLSAGFFRRNSLPVGIMLWVARPDVGRAWRALENHAHSGRATRRRRTSNRDIVPFPIERFEPFPADLAFRYEMLAVQTSVSPASAGGFISGLLARKRLRMRKAAPAFAASPPQNLRR